MKHLENKLIPILIISWILCFAGVISLIILTRRTIWDVMSWEFSLSWYAFLFFMAFAIPAKMVILIDLLTKDEKGV